MRLELKDISKSFTKGKVILDNISLSIEDSEFIVFLGPSGCGKTTLLRIIAGLETEDSGEILFDTNRVNDMEPKNRNIGMVFQNYALYPHMSVFENIAFPLKINKGKKSEIKKRVSEVAEFIGLSDYLDFVPKHLSGGQKQRVALGRAISRNPKLFLFDEPLSNLDAKLRASMRSELYNLHRQLKTTSIYVTHDQIEAMTMGDRIVIFNNAKIQQIGTPQIVYEQPANIFVATFIGSPQINLFNATVNLEGGNDSVTILGNNPQKIEISIPEIKKENLDRNGNLKLAIRPENLSVEPVFPNSFLFGKCEAFSVEFMGNETIINFKYNDEIKSLRTLDKVNLKSGEEFDLYFNLDKIILFDNNGNKI